MVLSTKRKAVLQERRRVVRREYDLLTAEGTREKSTAVAKLAVYHGISVTTVYNDLRESKRES